jgi:hypothetical protein
MNLLLQQKQMIDALEAGCQHLQAQVLPQLLDSLSLASNNHGSWNSLQEGVHEEETVGQAHNPMEVEEIGSPHSAEGQVVQDGAPP